MALVRHPLHAAVLAPLLLGTALVSPAALAQQRVGVNGAVNPNATGIPPGGISRELLIGQDVVFNERLATSTDGQTQILFVDESSMTVGPNSNMVINSFVYNPNTGAGGMAASLTRGVFRFVGGKLTKGDNTVTMRTPDATIGIRGGVVLVDLACRPNLPQARSNVCPDPQLNVIFVYGKNVTVTGLNGVSQVITRPGFEVTVAGRGASPSAPGPAPAGAAAALLAQLDGRPGGNGGASTVPTEAMVANSGIANVISSNVAASIRASSQTQPPATQPAQVSNTVQQSATNIQAAANQGLAANQGMVAASPPPPSPPPPSPPPLHRRRLPPRRRSRLRLRLRRLRRRLLRRRLHRRRRQS